MEASRPAIDSPVHKPTAAGEKDNSATERKDSAGDTASVTPVSSFDTYDDENQPRTSCAAVAEHYSTTATAGQNEPLHDDDQEENDGPPSSGLEEKKVDSAAPSAEGSSAGSDRTPIARPAKPAKVGSSSMSMSNPDTATLSRSIPQYDSALNHGDIERVAPRFTPPGTAALASAQLQAGIALSAGGRITNSGNIAGSGNNATAGNAPATGATKIVKPLPVKKKSPYNSPYNSPGNVRTLATGGTSPNSKSNRPVKVDPPPSMAVAAADAIAANSVHVVAPVDGAQPAYASVAGDTNNSSSSSSSSNADPTAALRSAAAVAAAGGGANADPAAAPLPPLPQQQQQAQVEQQQQQQQTQKAEEEEAQNRRRQHQLAAEQEEAARLAAAEKQRQAQQQAQMEAERQRRVAALAEQQRLRREEVAKAQQQRERQRREKEAEERKQHEQREREDAKRRQAEQCAFPGSGSASTGQAATAAAGAQGNGPQHQQQQQQQRRGVPSAQHHQQQQQASAAARGATGTPSYSNTTGGTARSGARSTTGNRGPAPSIASSTRSHEGPSHSQVPSPTLFSNIIANEEAQELRTYARMIEEQNRRLAALERQHVFLESELEKRTSDLARMESTLERREKEWKAENDSLRMERDKWEENVQTEQTKNERLLDLVNRKDMEIQRMIQRKYDTRDQRHEHGHHPSHGHKSSRHHDRYGFKRSGSDKQDESKHGGRSRDSTPPPVESSIYASHITETERRITQSPTDSVGAQFKSPQEILATSGSVEAVRERNVTNSLLDFFGM